MYQLGFWTMEKSPLELWLHDFGDHRTPSLTNLSSASLETIDLDVDLDADIRQHVESELAYAIDDDETTEVDDAISLKIDDHGNEWIIIHIADITSVLEPHSALESVARSRVETIYLPHQKYNMLPANLSEDLISLRTDRPSRVLTFAMRINEDQGNIIDFKYYPGLAKIKRVNYHSVESILNKDDPSQCDMVSEIDRSEQSVLRRLFKYAEIRRAYRQRNGARTFQLGSPEIKRREGKINIIWDREKNAHKLVEEMMLLAGEAVANYASEHKIPIPYRTQDKPLISVSNDQSDIFELLSLIGLLPRAETIQRHEREDPKHFSVGTEYSRVTSPLRRYSDIITHAQLKAHLRGIPLPYSETDLNSIVNHIDRMTQQIKSLQKFSEKYWLFEHLREKVGQTFNGVVYKVVRPKTDSVHHLMWCEVWIKEFALQERLLLDPVSYTHLTLPTKRIV
eukprot:TRINITY_DN4199_c0_g1_i1.p1 TRINITY_DN4199_c0_g1~~TRINITY_DN4199_c0_g1_i1.p1  ORF type:complete len:453 (+),score=50.69 TRINITY_DN4199_c0_g1_i1:465-1823(+)